MLTNFPLKGGPMDGETYTATSAAEFYWLVPWSTESGYRLVPNHADVKYAEIEDAVGLYQRVVMIVDRHREDYLLFRELPHGEAEPALVG